MTVDPGFQERQLLPRWREWSKAAHEGGELTSLNSASERASAPVDLQDSLSRLRADFRREPNLFTAGDLLSLSVLAGAADDVVLEAVGRVEASSGASSALRRLAVRVVAGPAHGPVPEPELDVPRLQQRVARHRQIVRAEPRNALRWADLALAHAMLGDRAPADREMRVALALAPTSRFVVRAAARQAIFQDDPERAHDLLVKSGDLALHDPWVMAAEIAVSEVANRASRNVRRATRILESKQYDPVHLSELASAVGTLELRAGNRRSARRLLEQSLLAPNGNSLAQAEWAVLAGINNLELANAAADPVAEAPARHAMRTGAHEDAVRYGKQWLAEQPFAAEPAIFVSFQASVWHEDYETSRDVCMIGLRTNPDSRTLKNNLAVALAHLDFVDQARAVLVDVPVHADASSRDDLVLLATHGLVAFRQGALPAGRDGYRSAVSGLRRIGEPDLAALAAIMWAREELRAGTPESVTAYQEAEKAAQASSMPEVVEWKKRLQRISHPSSTDIRASADKG